MKLNPNIENGGLKLLALFMAILLWAYVHMWEWMK